MPEASLYRLFTGRLNQLGFRYMVTGSVAAKVHGEPHFTNGVDLVLFSNQADIPRLADAFLPRSFAFRLRRSSAWNWRARGGHFNRIHHKTGYKADVYLGGNDPFHAWAMARVRRLMSEGEPLVLAPPA